MVEQHRDAATQDGPEVGRERVTGTEPVEQPDECGSEQGVDRIARGMQHAPGGEDQRELARVLVTGYVRRKRHVGDE